MLKGVGTRRLFRKSLALQALPVQRVEATFAWENPDLWSPEHPNLYTVQLQVAGKTIQDIYPHRVGFREFWEDGRKFFLNGQEIRLRPSVLSGHEPRTEAGIDRFFDGSRAAGFNIIEQWPADQDVRGIFHAEPGVVVRTRR